MPSPSELNRSNYPEWLDHIVQSQTTLPTPEPRTYPGYPRWPLPRLKPRRWVALDRTLIERRSIRELGPELLDIKQLARLLQFSHGISGSLAMGPTPSAGGLQALELYIVNWAPGGWLPTGIYHYDRSGHHLSQIRKDATVAHWKTLVPAIELVSGGSLLWVIVGNQARVAGKYDFRAERFLLLEAGHLMQNLCLIALTLEMSVVPLGGVMETAVARELQLPASDQVLYVAISGLC